MHLMVFDLLFREPSRLPGCLGQGGRRSVKTTGKISYITNFKSWNSRWGGHTATQTYVTYVTSAFCFWI